ncbi:MAG: tetratricopeptide repeat protein [Nanoarchaeota archaeon]|nr:tetratricopeptide repeat protein [Nanoarchaeota archaeon]
MNQKLVVYIKEAFSKGYSTSQIREALMKQGYDKNMIDENIGYVSKTPKSSKKTMFIISIVILLIIIGSYSGYVYFKDKAKEVQPTQSSEETFPVEEVRELTEAQKSIDSGWELYRQDKFNEAVIQFSNAVSLSPDDRSTSIAYTGMGASYFLLKDYEKSKDAMNKALSLNPNNNRAHTGLGFIYLFDSKDYNKAEEEFNQALSIDQNDDDAYAGLCGVYYNLKDYDKAKEDCNKALSVNPTNAIALTLNSKM